MIRSEHPQEAKNVRRGLSARAAGLAAFTVLAAVGLWSACAIDDRTPEVQGALLPSQGGSGGNGSGGNGPGVSAVEITPSAIALGPVVVGAPARARLHIANKGDVPFDAPRVTLAAGGDAAFSILHDGCEAPVAPGQECDVRLQVLAQRAGNVSAQLDIDAAGATTSLPLSATGNDTGSLVLAPAAGSSDNFGSVRLGTATQAVFDLTNAGSSASGPISLHLYNEDVTLVVGNTGSCADGAQLTPGQTCEVHLAFGPNRRGAIDAMLVVTSDAGSVGLPLNGRGVIAGALGVSQPSLDFDGVVLGDAGQRALRVLNQGDEPLALLGVTLEGEQASEYSIQSSDCTGGRALGPGAGCDVITQFRPATSGDDKRAALTVAMSDGSPQVVELTGAGLDQGSLTVTPAPGSTGDFGAVLLGQELTQVFQIANGSTQTSGPIGLSVSGDFELVTTGQAGDCQNTQTSLENGASCSVTVKLAPRRRAAQFGSLSIRSPLAKSASLRLAGTGTAPARLALLQDEVNFGRVLSGGAYQASLTLLNQGDEPLSPPLATLVDANGAMPPGFSLDNRCTAPLGFEASCAVLVSFQPAQPGFPLALLRLESDGGKASAVLYGEVSPAGILALAPAEGESPDFGDVAVQTAKAARFTLSNPGTLPTGRLSITTSSPLFSVDPSNCNGTGQGLASAGSCTFTVTYRPLAAAAATATLSIQSPAAGGAALSLTGQGRSPASVTALGNRDFGTANIGQPAATAPSNDFTWTITNGGDLATGTLQVSNSNTTDFSIASDTCSGQSIAGHLSCDVALRFRPTTIDAHTGDLVVTDTASSQSVTLKMTGNGVKIAQPGESCVNATCATGMCTGGVCCDRACTSSCQVCDATGVCQNQSNRERCGSGVCFGVDQCLLPEGQACTLDNQCGNGNCEQRIGGTGVGDRVCCLQNCPPGDQCSPDGRSCQAPTLEAGTFCSAATLACGDGLTCKACLDGSTRCTDPADCCGGCEGDLTCQGGTCQCPIQSGTTRLLDCRDGRCIQNRAGACCDDNGCSGDKVCNSQTNLCGCPANATRDCGNDRCIPNAQCCAACGDCQTCSNGSCLNLSNGQQGNCGAGRFCENNTCISCTPGVETLVPGVGCRVNNGQACTVGGAPCMTGACTQYFVDRDGDLYGDKDIPGVFRCGSPGVPAGGGTFRTLGGDCCDIAGNQDAINAHPDAGRFPDPLPAACVRRGTTNYDYNCNGSNEGARTVNCSRRLTAATCRAGNTQTGREVGDIVPVPQVDAPDPTEGVLLCGTSVGPGFCDFFGPGVPNTQGQGNCETGCCPTAIGFTRLPCN